VVDYLCALCDGFPAIEFADTFVSLCGVMLVFRHDPHRIRNGSKNVLRKSETGTEWMELRGLPSSSGFAKEIMSSGRISGIPPTRVDTTYSPAQAASKMAMQKASVKEVFKNIVPRAKTYQSLGSNS
jgi:hypothetical protein